MRKFLIFLPALFILFMPRHVEALGVAGLSITVLDCTGFSASGYTATFDRDNTGTGSESIEISVRDSAGTLLWISTSNIPLGTYTVDPAVETYDLASPVNGDLSFMFRSLAGNSLEEQIAFTTTGFCAIPTATPTPTLTPTLTPTPTPTLAATPGPTAISEMRSTLMVGEQAYEVTLQLEMRPAEYLQVGFSVVMSGLLMLLLVVTIRRSKP